MPKVSRPLPVKRHTEPEFRYLLLVIKAMDDVPLRLYDNRADAERDMWKRMNSPRGNDVIHYRIEVFKDGLPDSTITELTVELTMKGAIL